MRSLNHRSPATEHTSATSKNKRKHPFHNKQQYHHRKKQKSVSEIEKTLTLKPHSSNQKSLPLSNRFQSIQRKKRHNYSSNFEFNRKWTFASHDSSAYKGVENASKHPDLYFKIPSEFMEWDRRKLLVCKEMHNYNAGIFCFQEVDRFDDLADLLRMDGFRGVYKARAGEACVGFAVFWKDKLFTLLHEHLEFQRFGLRNNVAQFCVLRENIHKKLKLSGWKYTCTLQPKPWRYQARSGSDISQKSMQTITRMGQLIIGGDLNRLPQFLTASELDVLLHDRRNISGQLEHPQQQKDLRSQDENVARSLIYRWSDEELRLATGNEELTHLQHELKLYSAYLGVPGSHGLRDNRGEPLATSYHSKFMGAVDYIWHTKGLVPVRVLETLPINILRRSAGLPNEKWGSDHLALVCELAFANDGTIV